MKTLELVTKPPTYPLGNSVSFSEQPALTTPLVPDEPEAEDVPVAVTPLSAVGGGR